MDIKQHLDDLKKIHDYHATQSNLLKTRFQFYYEEFDGIKELVAFSDGMAKELNDKIEALESKIKEENPPYPSDEVV